MFRSNGLYYQIMQPAMAEGCKRKTDRRAKNHIDKTDDFKSDKTKRKRRNRMKKSKMTKTPEARH